MTSHDHHTHRILTALETSDRISQRSLSRSLGIALGLTNLLIRKLVRKGWVRVIHIKPNRVRYLLTPAGIAEKARMSREVLQNNIRFYAEARDRIRERFAQLSSHWESDGQDGGQTADDKRIVFFGAGEVAEIGYVCLQETDLNLVGVVDDQPRGDFFGLPVRSPDQLQPRRLCDVPYDRVVVMTFQKADQIRAKLEGRGFPRHCVFSL